MRQPPTPRYPNKYATSPPPYSKPPSFRRKPESIGSLRPSTPPQPPKTAQHPYPPPAPHPETYAPAQPPSPETLDTLTSKAYPVSPSFRRNPESIGLPPRTRRPRPRRHRKPIDRHNRRIIPPPRESHRDICSGPTVIPRPRYSQANTYQKTPTTSPPRRHSRRYSPHSGESRNPSHPNPPTSAPPQPQPPPTPPISPQTPPGRPCRGSPDHTAKSRGVEGPNALMYRLASRASPSSRSNSGRSIPASHESAATKVSVLPSSGGPCVMTPKNPPGPHNMINRLPFDPYPLRNKPFTHLFSR